MTKEKESKVDTEKEDVGKKDDDDDDDSSANEKRIIKIRKMTKVLLVLPYLVGMIWTGLHPVISVITGELKCRGWFIDEHSIETKFADVTSWDTPSHLKMDALQSSGASTITRLCENPLFNQTKSAFNIHCHQHKDVFDMASILPLANSVNPVDEAIVFVIPAWNSSNSVFHTTLLHSLSLLADPQQTPWLAKRLLVVSPAADHVSLEDVVSRFLDAYLDGTNDDNHADLAFGSSTSRFPPKLCASLIRNLIVIDIHDNSQKGLSQEQIKNASPQGVTRFSLLPQGRRGVLPNMDLVFLVGRLLSKSWFLVKHPLSMFVVHPFPDASKQWKKVVEDQALRFGWKMKPSIRTWMGELVDLGLFAKSMALGPYPPHATALDHDIDSLTISIQFDGIYSRDPSVELIQQLEHLLRALSNLHERLHHSLALYLLPSPRKFVSHVEYLIPNLLVLLPLAVRALSLIFLDMPPSVPNVKAIGMAIATAIGAMGVMFLSSRIGDDGSNDENVGATHVVAFLVYSIALTRWGLVTRQSSTTTSKRDESSTMSSAVFVGSLQFAACVMAVYALVPIAFAHVSLAYVPSLVFTAALAIPNYMKMERGILLSILTVASILFVPVPFIVPRIFQTYTAFVQYAFIPLHLQWMSLLVVTWMMPMKRSKDETTQ